MFTDVTDEQIDRYREDGFLVIDRLLDEAELDEWRKRVTEATDNMRDEIGKSGRVSGIEDQVDQFSNVSKFDERVMELIDRPDLTAMVRRLIGTETSFIVGDQAMFKQPWGMPTFFHYDASAPGWKSQDGSKAMTLWVALEDATVENGCLAYVPGSHKRTVTPAGPGSIGKVFEVNPGLADLGTVTCPVKAGGAVMHSGNTVHGSGANITNTARRAFSFSTWGR